MMATKFQQLKELKQLMQWQELKKLPPKVVEVSKSASKQGCVYYKEFLEKNKEFVQEPPTPQKCILLSKQLFYTRLASIPVRYEKFWGEFEIAKQILKKKPNVTAEEVGIGLLFALELYAWLFAGKVVGRRFSLTGYHV